MPTAGGPNTLGESNLVFAYDTGDVKNSYRGQPTVNGVGTLNGYNPLDLYTWAPNGNTSTWARDTSVTSPLGGIPLKEISSGTDSYSDTYNNSNDNIIAASSGQTWTVSVYALAAAGTNLQVWIFGANSSGNYIELAANGFTATGQWQRISVTMTFSNGSTAYVQSRVATSTNGGVIWWDGLQVEQKSYPTPFVNGTRSATQGLLPLIGNSTIDLSNVSFDSSAKMTFDGTNDYINVPYNTSHNLTSQGTVSAWINPATLTQGSYAGIVAQCTGGSANQQAYQLSWRQVSNAMYGAICNGSGTYDQIFASLPTVANVWYNIVFTWNGSQLVMYNNGVVIGTATQTINNQILSTDLTIGGYTYKGAGGSGEAFNGKIDKVELYNRALTAQEVKQNYQQYKTRFNLS